MYGASGAGRFIPPPSVKVYRTVDRRGVGEACSVALSGAFRYLCVKQPFSRYVLILHQKDRPRAGVPCALGLRSLGLRHHAPGAP